MFIVFYSRVEEPILQLLKFVNLFLHIFFIVLDFLILFEEFLLVLYLQSLDEVIFVRAILKPFIFLLLMEVRELLIFLLSVLKLISEGYEL